MTKRKKKIKTFSRHHLNKETCQRKKKFGQKELNRFKKIYRDFESIRTKRKLSHHIRLRTRTHLPVITVLLGGISVMKNEIFLQILSYCLVKIPYIILWVFLNKCLPNDSLDTEYAVFEIGVNFPVRYKPGI